MDDFLNNIKKLSNSSSESSNSVLVKSKGWKRGGVRRRRSPDPVGASWRIPVGGGDGGRNRSPDPLGTG